MHVSIDPVAGKSLEGKCPISMNYFPKTAEKKVINFSPPFSDGLDRLLLTNRPRDHRAWLVTVRIRNSVQDPRPRSIGTASLATMAASEKKYGS